jgi:hypothetical protein
MSLIITWSIVLLLGGLIGMVIIKINKIETRSNKFIIYVFIICAIPIGTILIPLILGVIDYLFTKTLVILF